MVAIYLLHEFIYFYDLYGHFQRDSMLDQLIVVDEQNKTQEEKMKMKMWMVNECGAMTKKKKERDL
jgi:hypothetical protein